jgi:hypothetical protein
MFLWTKEVRGITVGLTKQDALEVEIALQCKTN